MNKVFVFIEMFQGIVHDAAVYTSMDAAINNWESYTESKYRPNQEFDGDDEINEKYAGTSIWTVDTDLPISEDVVYDVFVGGSSASVEVVELYSQGDQSIKRWESFTGHSYAEYAQEPETLSEDHLGITKIFVAKPQSAFT